MILTLDPLVDDLAPAFTQPSLLTCCDLLLGWVMCLGKRTLSRVADHVDPRQPRDRSQRHGLDSYYNFFERSAWTPRELARRVALLVVTRLNLGGVITLLVDDTLAHKRGRCVWGLGWFRDAVASTRKRTATASGHNWVVVAVAFCLPFSHTPVLALPLLARLRRPGKEQPGCAALARDLVAEVLGWFPGRRFILVGDGAYACKEMLRDLDGRVTFVGRLRGDATVYDPRVPAARPGQRGPKAKKGPRLPKPREAAARADRKRTERGDWVWQAVEVPMYGRVRRLCVLAYEAVWPRVLGLRPARIVVVRDPEGRLRDGYLFTTDLEAEPGWVIVQFSQRWSIECLFRSSKQVMDVEAPQHWSQGSVEKVAPWVWGMQGVIMVWYITEGYHSAEASEMRESLGPWDSEWSLRHMMQVLRRSILDATINPNSANEAELREMVQTLKNWVNLAA
jgi:hypothetical protein